MCHYRNLHTPSANADVTLEHLLPVLYTMFIAFAALGLASGILLSLTKTDLPTTTE